MNEINIDVKNLNQTIMGRRIPHGTFKEAFDKCVELMKLRDYGLPGSGIMVMGPSGSGKTTLTKAVFDYGIKHYGEDSVVRTQLETGSTVKALLQDLICAFGEPRGIKSTSTEIAKRLTGAVSERGCRLIVVDEFQHLIPGGSASAKTIDNILNTFKILDETGVSFLLTGMESIGLLWSSDPQIRSRFQTYYYLSSFIYPKDRSTWINVVRKYLKTLEEFRMSVECENFEDRCFAATGGSMRQLVLILTSAVVNAYEESSHIITNEHLRIATQKQVDELDGLPNAFDVSLEKVMSYAGSRHYLRELASVDRGLGDIFVK